MNRIERRTATKDLVTAAGLAFGLLTRLPMPAGDRATPAMMGASLPWYPVVGLAVGAAISGLSLMPLPGLLLAALIVLVWIAITGGLHLDGLADCADAWVGGMGNRERTLQILKDPASGPMAVTALVLVILVKLAAIGVLLEGHAFAVLLLIPVAARALLSLAFATTPYVREAGMGEAIASHCRGKQVAAAVFVVTLAIVLILPVAVSVALLATGGAVFWLWRRAMVKRLGGFTGDGAGALVEMSETALLLASSILAGWQG